MAHKKQQLPLALVTRPANIIVAGEVVHTRPQKPMSSLLTQWLHTPKFPARRQITAAKKIRGHCHLMTASHHPRPLEIFFTGE